MNGKPVIILGNGGHAKVLIDSLLLNGQEIIGYTAPSPEDNAYNLSYLGNDSEVLNYNPNEIFLVNAIGSTSNTSLREKLFNRFKSRGYFFSSVIHPSVILASNTKMGEGVQLLAGAVVQPFTNIDDNTIINTSVSIDHDCHIGKHCHIAPGSTLSGNVIVGECTHIGTGSTVIQNIIIGQQVLIGAGSVVLHNVEHNKIVYGTPAKEVK